MSVKWCNAGWFQSFFYYGFCPDKKSWDKQMKKFKSNEGYPDDSAGKMTSFTGKGISCIVTIKDGIEDQYSAVEIASLITHEAVHVWQELRDYIGEDTPSAEFEAYSIQTIAQELMQAFEETRRPLSECDKEKK